MSLLGTNRDMTRCELQMSSDLKGQVCSFGLENYLHKYSRHIHTYKLTNTLV